MKKISSVFVIVLAFFVFISSTSMFAHADDIIGDARPEVGAGLPNGASAREQSAVVSGDVPMSYYNYITAQTAPNAAAEICVDGADVLEVSGGEVVDYQGEENAVKLYESGAVTYALSVPESAMYTISADYFPIAGKGRDFEISLAIDGRVPFAGASNLTLKRAFKDIIPEGTNGEFETDVKGNQFPPEQEEVFKWMSGTFSDRETFNGCEYLFYFEKGEHTLTFNCTREAVVFGDIVLRGFKSAASSDEVNANHEKNGYKEATGYYKEYEAEHPFEKSDTVILPVSDRSSPKTQPYGIETATLNTIGKESWSKQGQWISYQIEVPESGLYEIGVKFKQDFKIGMATCRNIYIDGNAPSESFMNVAFPYKTGWQHKNIADSNGDNAKIYFESGRVYVITFEVSLGSWAEVLTAVDQINVELNEVYRKILMVTGSNPDPNRDYYLERQVSGLTENLQDISKRIDALANLFDELNKTKGNQSESLRRVAKQLMSFAEKPETIAVRLPNFSDNIMSLSSWLMDCSFQPLEIDYFTVKSSDAETKPYKANVFEVIKHEFTMFVNSFMNDYSSFSGTDGSGETVKVWINSGRSQAQIVRTMIDSDFTKSNGIEVDLSIVSGTESMVASTLAGTGPDVALMVPRGQPVNLAWRGALADLTQFGTYGDVESRFSEGATIPYSFNDGVYALPCTQTFFMMFYRTDIFAELDVKPPETWGEIFSLSAILQRRNMSIGIPYFNVTAQGAVDTGLGTKDVFATLLTQNGGELYNDIRTDTALNSREAFEAFKLWTDFYTLYGYSTDYNFNTRFRTGEMPIGIAPYEMYNTFSIAAPEIRNQWAMTRVPGTVRSDGTVDYSVVGSGTANIQFKNAKHPEASWKFMDWFTSAESQLKFGLGIENLFGPSSRYSTANLEAFEMLPWSQSELDIIGNQREFLSEVPEVPGGYFTTRCLDNAFRDVVYSGKNAKETFDRQNKIISQEIIRKNEEVEKLLKRQQ